MTAMASLGRSPWDMMMTDGRALAFLFAYVPKMPRSAAEYSQISALRKQAAIVRAFAQRKGLEPPFRIPAVTTYRNAVFTQNDAFNRAVTQARERGQSVWIADIWDLLLKTRPERLEAALQKLDDLDVDVLDCVHGKHWKEFTGADRVALLQKVSSRKIASAAQRNTPQERETSHHQNALRGAAANRREAKRRAGSLRPTVEALKSSLPVGTTLTPSMLMHHLNNAGIKPDRAQHWSLNSCKNLLKRLQTDEE